MYKVLINKDGVRVTPDNSLQNLGNYDVVARMKSEFGEKVAIISIGQAGERKKKGVRSGLLLTHLETILSQEQP